MTGLGLILFGDNAYLQVPLTFDRKTVQVLLDEAFIGMAGESTAIGDAIGLAVKRLRKNPSGQKVLILLTDGANTSGVVTPLKAAELAAGEGLKIYTVGIGADEMIVRSFFWESTGKSFPGIWTKIPYGRSLKKPEAVIFAPAMLRNCPKFMACSISSNRSKRSSNISGPEKRFIYGHLREH